MKNKKEKRVAKRLTKAQKEEIIKKIQEGKSLRKISQELGISYLTAYNYYHKVKGLENKESENREIVERLDRIEKKIEELKSDLYHFINQEKKTYQEPVKVDLNQDIYQREISKNPDDYITFEEASKILKVSKRQISDYLKRGLLKGVWRGELGLYGRGRMILKKSVEEMLRVKKEKGVL